MGCSQGSKKTLYDKRQLCDWAKGRGSDITINQSTDSSVDLRLFEGVKGKFKQVPLDPKLQRSESLHNLFAHSQAEVLRLTQTPDALTLYDI